MRPQDFVFSSLLLSLSLALPAAAEGPAPPSVERYEGPIIDMHLHAYTLKSAPMMFGLDHPNPLTGETYKGVATGEEQWERTSKRLEANRIVRAVVSDGQLWHEKDPERILIAGRNLSVEELRKMHEAGRLHAIGELNPFYEGVLAGDPKLKPYFDLAEELGVPVGFHVMPGGPPGAIYRMGMTEVRARNASPLQLEDVLVSHPTMRLWVMHGGWPYIDDMKALLYAHPQVHLDVSAISWILPRAEFHDYLERLVKAGFLDRILFGSDQMTWPETIDLAIDAVNSAPFLTLEQKEDIFFYNAARFLALTAEEIAEAKQ